MSELIDRQALLDECLNHYEVGNIEQNCTMDWICKTVRNFPAATRWVRCEEKLPEKNGAYAACWLYSEQYYWEKAIFWDGKWKMANGNGLMEPDYWMPLPEPPTGTERSET